MGLLVPHFLCFNTVISRCIEASLSLAILENARGKRATSIASAKCDLHWGARVAWPPPQEHVTIPPSAFCEGGHGARPRPALGLGLADGPTAQMRPGQACAPAPAPYP
eukprot:2828750-Pyramimonas_sp.AAC.2